MKVVANLAIIGVIGIAAYIGYYFGTEQNSEPADTNPKYTPAQ